MSRKKAESAKLDALHGALAEFFEDVLTNGERITRVDKETGAVITERAQPSAAMVNQIRTFLKDNHIEVDPTKSRRLDNILKDLPFTDDEVPSHEGATH